MSNNFSPESTNPRQRRAYAHSILHKARSSGSIDDFIAAQWAVTAAGESTKSKGSGFTRALTRVATMDPETRVIVEVGDKILDTHQTPRFKMTWVGTKEKPFDLVSARRYSPDFDLYKRLGTTIGITEVRDQVHGSLHKAAGLEATNHEIGRVPLSIPITEEHTVDAIAVRGMHETMRREISDIASRIE